jgi:hypothetical protein
MDSGRWRLAGVQAEVWTATDKITPRPDQTMGVGRQPVIGLPPRKRGVMGRAVRPTPGAARPAPRRCAPGDRSLRQGKQGDTVEAIAPDAATLRSRHVARRMGPTRPVTALRLSTLLYVAMTFLRAR